MALNGIVETSAYEFKNGTRTVILQWSATQNYLTRETTLSWEAVGGGTYTGNPIVCELRVTIDGAVEFYKEATSANRVNCSIGTVLASGTKVIKHNTDGTRQVTMSVEAGISEWAINHTGSKTFTLDVIPQDSEIGATDANIGSKSTIVISKQSSSYTHSIKYEFGNLSGYITSNGGISSSEVKFSATSVSFTIPSSFYAEIPNAKSGECKLTCTTYLNSTKIGEATTTSFTVTAAASVCAPSVSGTVADVNSITAALTGDASKLIRYFSEALCTITATAKNSATIKTKKIGGVVVTGNTRTIPGIEASSVEFSATDSRGYSSSVNVKSTLIPYVKLTANAYLNRVDPTSGNAILSVKGNYFKDSFGAVSNSLSVKYRIGKSGESYGSWIEVSPVIGEDNYTLSIPLSGLDYRYAYSAQVVCEDKLVSKDVTATVSKGIPVADWGESDFRFNVPVVLSPSSYGTSLPGTGKQGQLFWLDKGDGTYEIHIHNGVSW